MASDETSAEGQGLIDEGKWTESTAKGFAIRWLEEFPETAAIQRGDHVSIHYTGRLRSTGQVFDDSRMKKPIHFDVGAEPRQVIRGMDEALLQVRLGERALFYIRNDWGYGAQGHPPREKEPGPGIPPNADLLFDVDILALNGVKRSRPTQVSPLAHFFKRRVYFKHL